MNCASVKEVDCRLLHSEQAICMLAYAMFGMAKCGQRHAQFANLHISSVCHG